MVVAAEAKMPEVEIAVQIILGISLRVMSDFNRDKLKE
jgi:hypothetical protein